MRVSICTFFASIAMAGLLTFAVGGSSFAQTMANDCDDPALPWLAKDVSVSPMDSMVREPLLRVATFNIRAGLGPSWAMRRTRTTVAHNLEVIAAAIAAMASQPLDVLALNEVDFPAGRSGNIDQADYLARALEQRTGVRYRVIYGQTRERYLPGFGGRYGNAVLVRHAVVRATACLYDRIEECGVGSSADDLPALRSPKLWHRFTREARGLIALSFEFDGRPIDAIVTHLDALAMPEREAQASHLLRRMVNPQATTLLLGDVNAVPAALTRTRPLFRMDRTYEILTSGVLADARVMHDARTHAADFSHWATYPAGAPKWPLDGIFGSLDLVPLDVRVIASGSSDHLGLYATYRLSADSATIAAQRASHRAIRVRQMARLTRCGFPNETNEAKIAWLKKAMAESTLLDIETASSALSP